MPEFGIGADNRRSLIITSRKLILRDLLVEFTSEDDVREAENAVYLRDTITGNYRSTDRMCFVGHLCGRYLRNEGHAKETRGMPGPFMAAKPILDRLNRGGGPRWQASAITELVSTLMGWNDDGRFMRPEEMRNLLRRVVEVRTRRGTDGEFRTIHIDSI